MKSRQEIIDGFISKGVKFTDPDTVFISNEVKIGVNTEIAPFVMLSGKTIIGKNVKIDVFSNITDCIVADNVNILSSTIEESVIEEDVKIGPYSHIRSGCHICKNVTIGNYAELKNTIVGKNSRVSHVGYIGDAEIGENVNIGAGTITCNFDGKNKHKTVIEDNAFIGSDTIIVAPAKIARSAITGAGSVITKNVKSKTLVYGVPAKEKEK